MLALLRVSSKFLCRLTPSLTSFLLLAPTLSMAIDWTQYTPLRYDSGLGLYDSRYLRTVDQRDDMGNISRMFSDLDGNLQYSNTFGRAGVDANGQVNTALSPDEQIRQDALRNSLGRLGGDPARAFDQMLQLGRGIVPDLTEDQLFTQAQATKESWMQRYGQPPSEFQSYLDFTADTLNPLLSQRLGRDIQLQQLVPEWQQLRAAEDGATQAAWQSSNGASGWRGWVDTTLNQGITQFILMSLAGYGAAAGLGGALANVGVAGADAGLVGSAFSVEPVTAASVAADAAVAENALAGVAGGFGDLSGTVGSELSGLNAASGALFDSDVRANVRAIENPNGPGLSDYAEVGRAGLDALKPFLDAFRGQNTPAPEQGLITDAQAENPLGIPGLFRRAGSGDPEGRLGSGLLLFNTGDPALYIP